MRNLTTAVASQVGPALELLAAVQAHLMAVAVAVPPVPAVALLAGAAAAANGGSAPAHLLQHAGQQEDMVAGVVAPSFFQRVEVRSRDTVAVNVTMIHAL